MTLWWQALGSAPWVPTAAVVSIVLYLVGRRRLIRRSARLEGIFTRPRALCFLAGWLLLVLAIASPLDVAAERLLSWHMVQHMLLTVVVPPLWWLGAPVLPGLTGLPRSARQGLVGPVFAAPAVRAAMGAVGHPTVGWAALTLTTLAWHLPAAYELALRDPWWHRAEHVTMLLAGVLFWRPVVASPPFRPRWPRLAMIPYLVTADLANTVVAASLAFAGGVVYPWYAPIAAGRGTDPMLDQQLAAGIMWVPGSLILLVPAVVIAARRLVADDAPRARPASAPRSIPLPVLGAAPEGGDLLRLPILGWTIRRSGWRLAVRVVVLVGLAAIVLDGLLGPRPAPSNAAGTFPWTHWRGLAIVGILVFGNVACFACPLIAPRTILRRWIVPTRRWPRALRSKWIAFGLVMAWLVFYEMFDPWDVPAMTAWILVGFVVAATVVDLCFEGASFCRYVCPLGQYQMAMSTMSTRTVATLDPEVCESCRTHDCLRGGPRGPGCGLGLFPPRKTGNLDCTFCLDCVTACPHGNIGVVAQTPGRELVSTRWRSGLRAVARRLDLALLLLAISVGGLVNALGMTAPIVAELDRIQVDLGVDRRWVEGAFVVLATLAGVAVVLVLPLATGRRRWRETVVAWSFATLPLGVGVWLVHLGFHLVTGWSTADAVVGRVAHDLGWRSSVPDPLLSCCAPPPPWLVPVEYLVLSVSLAASLAVAWWGRRDAMIGWGRPIGFGRLLRGWSPAAVWLIAFWACAAWMVLQPMEMRGTSGFAP